MMTVEYALLSVAVLLLASIVASRVSGKLGVPVLIVFLFIGMFAGSEGPGGIYFDDPWMAQYSGIVALSFIIFSGGLGTAWKNIRPVIYEGIVLSTFGVLITAFLVGFFARLLFDFSLLESLLLGALVSSTDAAAVFGVMRTKKIRLKGQVRSLLELESGSNDPMAIFLTIGLIFLLRNPEGSVVNLVLMFIQQMGLGIIIGYIIGKGMTLLNKRLRLGYEGLYPVLSISLVLLAYSATTTLGGNGFLAVYISGIVVGNSNFIRKKSLTQFHDGLAWLMQIVMFLILGLLVFPSHLIPVTAMSLLISLFLMFAARPIGVFISLVFSKMSFREKSMISWVGLRGAVPIILATYPLLADIPNSEMMFNVVFFVVLTSALIQGWSIPLVARLLKVEAPFRNKISYPIEFITDKEIETDLVEFIIHHTLDVIGKSIVELGMPKDTLIVLINRNNKFIVPSGETILLEEDAVLILTSKAYLSELQRIFSKQKETDT